MASHGKKTSLRTLFSTKLGKIIHGDSLDQLKKTPSRSVDLIMTSPPYGLTRPKEYGNVHCDMYSEWFLNYAVEFKRILKLKGSLVIDLGGTWEENKPTRSLYQYRLLLDLVDKLGFHLAQEFFWWNPSKLPAPAEWVTIKRVRVKDAVNTIWWLSVSPNPKADNRNVLQPYSDSMKCLLTTPTATVERPSGHKITHHFSKDNGAAIPPNLLAIANTNSNSAYLKRCTENKIRPHPARYPAAIPEFFIRYLTDEQDVVLDPFAGSCVTGEVAENLRRKWTCLDVREDYLKGGVLRFAKEKVEPTKRSGASSGFYSLPKLGATWASETISPKDTTQTQVKKQSKRPDSNQQKRERNAEV